MVRWVVRSMKEGRKERGLDWGGRLVLVIGCWVGVRVC